jgi:hypothetical protein
MKRHNLLSFHFYEAGRLEDKFVTYIYFPVADARRHQT